MIWVHGPPGSGKSAIAQTICDSSASRGHLLGSYFFQRGSQDRGTIGTFVPTLACQIATAIPHFRKAIGRVVERDPAVAHQDCSTQFTKLILEPFQSQASPTDNPFLIVIDGLDECAGRENQREILENILTMTVDYPHVRFVVLSRPEPHIEDFFNSLIQTGDVTVTPVLPIDDHHSAIEDIYIFLRNKFDDLSRKEKYLPAPQSSVEEVCTQVRILH